VAAGAWRRPSSTPEPWDDLTGDEELKDEDDHQGRHVADHLNVGTADQPEKSVRRRSAEPNCESHEECRKGVGPRPSFTIAPHSATGGRTPAPRKLNVEAVSAANAR